MLATAILKIRFPILYEMYLIQAQQWILTHSYDHLYIVATTTTEDDPQKHQSIKVCFVILLLTNL